MLEQLINIFQILFLVKIAFLILTGIYLVFLLVVLKQAHAMQTVINDDGASNVVNGVALFNVFVGFSLFVAALVIL